MTPQETLLTAYWVVPEEQRNVPFGIGVTARSREDALGLIGEVGWPLDAARATVREHVRFEDLEPYVVQHMGPMVVRGVWYPCRNVGFGASGQ